jgi:hypothetical protein
MYKSILMAAMLLSCNVIFAADSTATQQEPTALKAAAETQVQPVQVPVVKTPAVSTSTITWSGMAMLRLREEITSNQYKTGVDSNRAVGTYQLGYKFGAKIKPNDQVLIQFDIGNNWYSTDNVTGKLSGDTLYTPSFSLAYAQWDPGYMHILAGIIPVKGSAMMDLIGVSLHFNKSYKKAGHIPWGVYSNFSQTGLKIGMPIMKDAFKLDFDFTAAMIEYRSAAYKADGWKFNCSALELLFDVPMSIAGATIKPQLCLIPNRSYNSSTNKSDMEAGAGIDLGYKVNNNVNLRAGFGYAHNSNTNSHEGSKNFDRTGLNSNIGTTIGMGPGKFDFDFNLSTEKDEKDTDVNDVYPFVDIKYAYNGLNKNFIITPRCRFFLTYPNAKYDAIYTIRPEVIITSAF